MFRITGCSRRNGTQQLESNRVFYGRVEQEFIRLGRARYHIGYHLLLGLEFLIAADIVRTIVSPTLEELGILGAIVVIRIVIGYFLGKEIEQFRQTQ